MKKVLIIGSKGMAGHLIYYQLKKTAAFNVVDIARDDAYFKPVHKLDVTQFDKLHLILKNEKPDFVINCVGVLNMDAEGDPGLAILLNSYLPHFLAREGYKTGFKLIHISTDCVFSGNKGRYREADVADGIGFYAQSKALGEIKYGNHLTIRTPITSPALQYPKGRGSSSLLKTASRVGINPSVFILSKTCFTFSGCCLAFEIRLPFPNSTSIFSVPRLTRLQCVLISRWPLRTNGAGTSSKSVFPFLRS